MGTGTGSECGWEEKDLGEKIRTINHMKRLPCEKKFNNNNKPCDKQKVNMCNYDYHHLVALANSAFEIYFLNTNLSTTRS